MPSERSIEELVRLAASGDDQAVADLYTETSSHAYYLALQLVKDEDAAQDVLQDAYVKALMNINTLEDPSKFQSWLNSIVVNTGKNYLKKRQPILFSQMEGNDDDNEPVDFADESEQFSPEATVDYSETKRLVKEMIDRLPEQQRIAIILYYMEDYSVGQIADFMGCSAGTVKSRLNYGRKQIEKDVLDLEKQGTKLYCVPLVPFLFWMFHTQVPAATISSAASATLSTGAGVAAGAATGSSSAADTAMGAAAASGATAGTTSATGPAAGAAATVGSAVDASTAANTMIGSAVGASGSTLDAATISKMAASAVQAAASSGAATTTGAMAGTTAAATGLSLGAKIGIAAAAVIVCIGGGAVVGHYVLSHDSMPSSSPEIVETQAAAEQVTEIEAPNSFTELFSDNGVMPYKSIIDDYSAHHYDLHLSHYGPDIVETDDYYELPDCELLIVDYLDSSLVEGKDVGDTIFIDGEERTISMIGDYFHGYKTYIFSGYDDSYIGVVETDFGVLVYGEDDTIHTETVYEGPIRFRKDVEILGSNGTTINDPQVYFYEPIVYEVNGVYNHDNRERQHGYNEYSGIFMYGDIEVDDQGYVIWYKERPLA